MKDEKMMILEMLSEGKITAEEASKLLHTLNITEEGSKKKSKSKQEPKFLRVRITDTDSDRVRANIQVPISILNIGTRFGAKFTSKIDGVETGVLKEAIEKGEIGKIVDIFDEEDGEHVEVFIE